MKPGKIAFYFWVLLLITFGISLGIRLVTFGLSGGTLLTIGVLQVLAVWYFWPREVSRPQTWSRTYRYPRRPSGSRQGATLVSAVVAMFIITLCLTMALQAYVHGSRARLIQARRTVALAACQEQIETLRARGYASLSGVGEHSFAVPTDNALQGRARVARGPVGESKQVTITVQWPESERLPAGQVSLSTIISARGVSG